MRVLLVGDTHGNLRWLEHVVFPAALSSNADAILQVGDFGWWPGPAGSSGFIELARQAPVPLWWIDGNHEDHDRLALDIATVGAPNVDGAVPLGGALTYLPRGARLDLDGVSVVVCGGAHSIDRSMRTPGRSWFDAEHITDDDVERCSGPGHATILVSHDAPAGWTIPNLPSDGRLPASWQAELPNCWAHRTQLARVMDAVTPALVVHGHYHSAYTRWIDTAWGEMAVVGLSEDGTASNMALLTCEQGRWTCAPLPLHPEPAGAVPPADS